MELPEALRRLQQGNIAPVDLAQAAIGPGVAVFSRYSKVIEADGSAMSVRTALGIINQVLDETLAQQEGDFDADTRWAVAWFDQFAMKPGDYGVAETLSKAKNSAVNALVEAGIVEARSGKVRLLAREELAQSFEVGIIQSMPVPHLEGLDTSVLATQVAMCFDLNRALDTANETSHAFTLPALLQVRGDSHGERAAAWRERVVQIQAGLAYHQRAIEEMVYRLYGIPDHERRAIEASPDGAAKETAEASGDDEEDAEELPAPPRVDQRALAVDLLFFAVGCAFGRWDVRASFEPALAPKLNSPFDPLPVCSPGMLIGPDGLPATRARIVSETWLRARPNVITLPPEGVVDQATIPAADYPLRIAWHGILVDDEGHEEDIAHRVRQVLSLLFGERADEWERDLCAAIGVPTMREYLRHPNLFFTEHIARYSKSRRKAPIYWLLQSDKRSYGIWLYCHRIGKDTLHRALNDYVAPKIAMEERRLAELARDKAAVDARRDGRETRRLLKEHDTLEKVVAELYRFREALKEAADSGYDPDLDDGVVLSIAPLHRLTPWKEAGAYWRELLAGKYPWSSVGKQLHTKHQEIF
jgi:hypothetical protein